MEGSSQPAPVGGRRRRARRGGNTDPVVVGRGMQGGEDNLVPEGSEMGGRRMTRKQRASVKKVARALKAANKKAFRLAMTLKKKLRR